MYLEEVPEALEKLEQFSKGIVGVLKVEAKGFQGYRDMRSSRY